MNTSDPTNNINPTDADSQRPAEFEIPENHPGFGYADAQDAREHRSEYLIEDLLPVGFGFITGPPKAGNSPHGGKSMLSRYIATAIIMGGECLGSRVLRPGGPVLMINLDEPAAIVSQGVKDFIGDELRRGIKISNAVALTLPRDFEKFEHDIKLLRPSLVVIDPLLRIIGGKDLKENSNTGPIIDGLRRLQRVYGCTILLVHHSIKDANRGKNDTASWLNGSTDLNSAWDFCLCLEYERSVDKLHLRCFMKHDTNFDMYLASLKNEQEEIVGYAVSESTLPTERCQQIVTILATGQKTVQELVHDTSSSEPTIKRTLKLLRHTKRVVQCGKRGKATIWTLSAPINADTSGVDPNTTPTTNQATDVSISHDEDTQTSGSFSPSS